jgi:hypothetical protein
VWRGASIRVPPTRTAAARVLAPLSGPSWPARRRECTWAAIRVSAHLSESVLTYPSQHSPPWPRPASRPSAPCSPSAAASPATPSPRQPLSARAGPGRASRRPRRPTTAEGGASASCVGRRAQPGRLGRRSAGAAHAGSQARRPAAAAGRHSGPRRHVQAQQRRGQQRSACRLAARETGRGGPCLSGPVEAWAAFNFIFWGGLHGVCGAHLPPPYAVPSPGGLRIVSRRCTVYAPCVKLRERPARVNLGGASPVYRKRPARQSTRR